MDFDQLINFTRTSSATFVGSNGLIQNTPQSRNLLTFTQEFDNAAWLKTATTVGANSTAAPDGTMTADTMTANAGTAINPRIFPLGVSATVSATTYTTSFFVKPGTHTFVQLFISSQTTDWCNFTLSGSGTVQNNGAAVGAITFDSATGYYRISMTYVAGGTNRHPGLSLVPSGTATQIQTWNPVGTETVFLWGAQLETGSTATTYTRNVGGRFPARFDYDPVTLAPRGILIEEQRTNLFTNSEFPNGVSDAPTRGGNVSATTFSLLFGNTGLAINNTGPVTSFAYKTNFTTVVSTTYTLSAFVRMNDGNAPSFVSAVTTDSANSFALVIAGSAVIPTTYTVTAMGNGFYRVSATATAGSASVNNGIVKYDTNDSRPFTVSGYQLEAGAFATSYIPTVASQVTRTADQATIVAPMFAPWYNQTEGSWVAEWMPYVVTGTVVAQISAATNNDRFQLLNDNGSQIAVTTAGVGQGGIDAGTVLPNAINKLAYGYRTNDTAASLAGGVALPDNTVTLPVVDRLTIGATVAAAGHLNGHIRRITYYPVRLLDTQLQALTA